MISLVNSARIKKGYSSLGYANPAIYASNGSIARDINDKQGSNRCFSMGGCCREGFVSAKGWDPVTGFGSVHFQAFHKYFMGLKDTVNGNIDDSGKSGSHSSPSDDPGSFDMSDFLYALFNTSWGVMLMSILGMLVIIGVVLYMRSAFGRQYPGVELSAQRRESRSRRERDGAPMNTSTQGSSRDKGYGSISSVDAPYMPVVSMESTTINI
jgi:hypothetical protein